MKELFKEIEYKGTKITVSNLGRVIWDGVERNHYYNADGYTMCTIKIPDKGWRSVFVHILVAIAFVPNPNNYSEINHIDYNRANPNSDNLEQDKKTLNIVNVIVQIIQDIKILIIKIKLYLKNIVKTKN